MSKTKKILIALMLLIAVLLIPNMVNATNEEPESISNLNIINNNITVTLEEIELDNENCEYKFGVSKTIATEPTEWLDLQDIEANKCTVTITSQNNGMRLILRSSDKCYLFIKNITDDEIIIKTQINLPQELNIYVNDNNEFTINYLNEKCATFYENLGTYQMTAVKINDVEIIEDYLEAKENDENTLNAVKERLPKEVPTNAWVKMGAGNDFTSNAAHYSVNTLINTQGLYMVWGAVSYIEGRSIYGFTLYDNYPDGYVLPEEENETKVESISLPTTATVELGKTLTLTPTFNPSTATNKSVTWTSRDETVATVDNAGKVTPKKVGSTIITVTTQDGNKTATCTVTVTAAEKTQLFMREKSSLNKYINFPTEIKYEDFFEKYEGKATLKNNLKPVTIVHQYAFVNHEKINEWNTKKAEMTDEEFEAFLDAEIKNYINENNWKDFSNLQVSIANWNIDNSDVVLFVKIETDTEVVTVYNGYGKGFSSIGKDNTNGEGKQPATTTKDTTTATKELPKTGKVLLIWIIGIVAVSGVVAHIRYKKLYM